MRKIWLLIFAIGLTSVILADEIGLYKDAWAYDLYAKNILEKGVFGLGGYQPSAWFMPGYPLFLAAIYALFGQENFLVIRSIQVVVTCLTIYLCGEIAESIGKGSRIWATLLAGIYLPFYYVANILLSESLFMFLTLLWVWHLLRSSEKRKFQHWFINGAILGIGCLVRPVLFFAALAVLGLWFLRKKYWQTLMVAAGCVVILLPWWTRNYLIFRQFVPFSLQGGEVLLGGTYPGYAFDPDDWPTGSSEVEINQKRVELARQRLRQQLSLEPRKWVGWQVKKAWLLWSAPYYRKTISVSYSVIYSLHWLLLILGLTGAWKARKNQTVQFILAAILAVSVVQVLTVGLDRYNLPLMGFVGILAAQAVIGFKKAVYK